MHCIRTRPGRSAVGVNVDKALGEMPFKITNPERIPAQRYYDQAFFDLENGNQELKSDLKDLYINGAM